MEDTGQLVGGRRGGWGVIWMAALLPQQSRERGRKKGETGGGRGERRKGRRMEGTMEERMGRITVDDEEKRVGGRERERERERERGW